MNPYYEYKHLGWDLLEFNDDHASYNFDTAAFWSVGDGRIYYATDSGCSCPTPFEDYAGDDADTIIQKLERVRDNDHAQSLYDSWCSGGGYRPMRSGAGRVEDKDELARFISAATRTAPHPEAES